jgi:hypothetical protein
VAAADPGPTYPVLFDPDQSVAEAYGLYNVPSAVWIDEEGRIARPPVIAPSDDTWRDFSGVDSEVHHDQLRRWVRDGVLPVDPDATRDRLAPPSPELAEARVERRLGAWLVRRGRADLAEGHFARAVELAPNDFTINRGSMPLRGQDPFGQEFFDFWQRWEAAGRPGYGAAEAS